MLCRELIFSLTFTNGVHACKCLKSCCNVVAPSERAQVPAFRPFFKKRQLYIFNVNKTLYLRDCLSKLIYDQFLTKANIKDFPFLDLKSVWKLGRKLQIMIIFILELWIEKMIENRGGEVDQHLRSSHVQITFYQSIEKNTIRHMIFCQHFFLTFFYHLRLHAKTSIFLCIFLRVEASSYE